MNDVAAVRPLMQREVLVHALYEAAELEHNLMCTYLYAALSLRDGEAEGLSSSEATAVRRWRQVLIGPAIEGMGHLAAVWNITSALGAAPRFGRSNFPLEPGLLPASVVVKLAPFNEQTLQHFIFLERPHDSTEPEGEGFSYERGYVRGGGSARLTPMGMNYETVGAFYAALGEGLRDFVAGNGEGDTFDGDPGLQLSPAEVSLTGARPVGCLKTALAAFCAIVEQGEGAPHDSVGSHYQKFLGIRAELRALRSANPAFIAAHPAATNPVLRRPPRPEGRVWLENPEAVATVDLANASYGLMLRLLGYAYALSGPSQEKSLAVDLAIGIMQAVVPLAEHAARLPAGPSNPNCNAGMSFVTLRDAGMLSPGRAAPVRRALRAAITSGGRARRGWRATPPRCGAAAVVTQPARRARLRPRPGRHPRRAGGQGDGPGDGIRGRRRASRPGGRGRGRRAHRRRETRPDLRGQALHPFALLRDRRAAGVPRQRAGAVDPPGRDPGRATRRDRP